MADKKPAASKAAQKKSVPSIQVRIDRLNDYEGSNIKAFASANIGGAFAIHGIRVVDSQKGCSSLCRKAAIRTETAMRNTAIFSTP